MKMSEGEEEKRGNSRLWRPVDLSIWAPGPARGRLGRTVGRVRGAVLNFPLALLVAAVIIPLFVPLSFLIVYSIVGPVLFGPVLIGSWSVLVVGFVVVMEKTGYAKNFENWNLPLKRILAVPLAFLTIILAFYLVRTILAPH
jgi:hypothetical protein